MSTIHTSILIEATPSAVWAVLTDFAAYSEWNPFISQLQGPLEIGSPLVVELKLPGQSPILMRPNMVRYEAGRTFGWLGHLWRPGIFDGEHIFELQQIDDTHTLLIQREKFSGILARPMLWLIGEKTRQGFEAMNESLRDRISLV